MSGRPVLRVAVPAPVRGAFDYLWEGDGAPPARGTRVRVPFGPRSRVGLCLGPVTASAVAPERLRPVEAVIDEAPLLPASALGLLEWAAEYYHHPIGEVVFQSLPPELRAGRPAQAKAARGRRGAESLLPAGRAEPSASGGDRPVLHPAQERAVAALTAALGSFRTFLLQGVTGSGKTEVYLRVIEGVVQAGRQALVLVPEIALTPQTVDRFRRRLPVPVAVLHSGLTESERLRTWLQARAGEVPVIVGTRSAVFVPLPRPGVVIVDEEHDLSYKQQEGFRYSARDVAVVRGQREGVPVLLGSATPSLESLHNAWSGRYTRLVLPERAAGAGEAALAVVDLKRRRMRHGLSEPLLAAVASRLALGEQTLLFLNRRGYAPTLLCHDCGWAAACTRCDARMTLHRRAGLLRCHHCGAETPVPALCPACRSEDLRPVGAGTERVETALGEAFPAARLARIDRDTVRRKGALESALRRVSAGEADVLIGTQMLAKGHHFPNVTLVGVIDADGGLFSADFRAGEHLAQRILQVAGRAGRGERPGEVLIQTHHPEHPLLRSLLEEGYEAFAARALEERREAGLPPFAPAALLRAEAADAVSALSFLDEARALLPTGPEAGGVQAMGPAPSPMERRAGRHRAQLLLLGRGRPALHHVLDDWLPAVEQLRPGHGVRWSLDVDPQEMA